MNEKKPGEYSLEEQIRGLIEKLDAYIAQYHGGSVELISFDGKVVKVHMGGACEECPISPDMGYKWIEGSVKQLFPEIERVEKA